MLSLEWPRPEIRPDHLRTQAIYRDSFGNVKLSALIDDLEAALPGVRFGDQLLLRTGGTQGGSDLTVAFARTFGDVPEGAPLLTADSYGRIALSVHLGSAVREFGIELDSVVDIGRVTTTSRPTTPRPAAPPPPSWPPGPPR